MLYDHGWNAQTAAFLGFLWVCAVHSACTETPKPTQSATPVEGEPLAVEAEPLVTLGTAGGDPDEEFQDVRTPFLMPSGRVVVPLAAYGEIRVFAPDGTLQATHGRPGEGPGEFLHLRGAWPRGDTIEAYDLRLNRITRFSPDGSVETVTLGPAGFQISSPVLGTFSNGWALTGITEWGYGRRDEISVAAFLRDGTFSGVVDRVDGMFRYSVPDVFTGPTPLSPFPWVHTDGEALFVGESSLPEIRIVSATGETLTKITWKRDQASPDQALDKVEELAVSNADPEDRPKVRAQIRSAPAPDGVPAFSSMLVDSQGFVWVRPYEVHRDAYGLGRAARRVASAGGTWWVFTSEGRRLGSVDLPSHLTPHQITADAVVGISRDELDLEYVHIHRLHRR